jgi:hypothetical protein
MKPKYKIGDVFASLGYGIVIVKVCRRNNIFGDHIYDCRYVRSIFECSPYLVRHCDSDIDKFKRIEI